MSPEFTLANLQSCIVSLIISESRRPVDKLRLISPTWNAVVLEYLSDRNNHPSHDFVEFENGKTFASMKVKVKAHLSLENKDHFQGLFRGWNTDATFDRVESPFLQLRSFFVGQKANENRNRLKLIFSRCSNISNLYLYYINRKTIEVIEKTLADVPIDNLFIFEKKCDKEFRAEIIIFTRVHNVQKVTISVEQLKATKLREFLTALTETVKEVDIFENMGPYYTIFGQSREFWEEKADELTREGLFTVQVMDGETHWKTHLLRLKITA